MPMISRYQYASRPHLRSPIPTLRIVSINTRAAEKLPGVYGVVTGADLPQTYGVIPWTEDEQALCTDRVRFVGDEVAAVAAIDEETADAAIALIQVEYEVLDAVLTPEDALAEGAPALFLVKRKGQFDQARPPGFW